MIRVIAKMRKGGSVEFIIIKEDSMVLPLIRIETQTTKMDILIIGMQIIEVERPEIETRLEIIVKMKIGMLGTAISKN